MREDDEWDKRGANKQEKKKIGISESNKGESTSNS